ncbi:deoxyribodipyrimidine photo-lyase [Roseimicrobium gellanilyticum]|uniref:Deoxyribodipyrimidine photo-lyase n=1 Tax=Roseimicrobium gellanilyticum TaxID=748857 RepID=A0A366HGQ2_9BACT|nr:deoxyribodipyrimidine photo-lyase [Roseimicrobium gellanilyticum]RBP41381.1 deoxyribodipyrimidine photo-lyase [Roseimicrobium gellanilyticum]
MPRVSIHWFRRDLRLTDNTALHHASKGSDQVVPAYILSTWKRQHDWTGPNRQHFLCGNLESLAKNLEAIGSQLLLRAGDAVSELERLVHETGASAVYTNRDPDPFGREVEGKVAAMCQKHGVEFLTFKDVTLHGPEEVLNGEGKPYRVYTPYSKNWLSLPKPEPVPAVKSLGITLPKLVSLKLPTVRHWSLPECTAATPPPGERTARDRMKAFISSGRLAAYADMRNTPAGHHSSCLSPDLRYGLIGIRELYQRCQKAAATAKASTKASIEAYVKELAWREFYMTVLHHWPEVLEMEFNPEFRSVPWDGDDAHYEAWKEGRTGFPIVDAGMRQLLATGWMHNRVRMIVSMFLTKDLHVHWRLGESWFMQQLVDGEIASNNGGWQWSAGTGADAAPYFRIQNPWTQTKRYDPEGEYIKQWVPELKDVAAEKLFQPCDTPLAKGYPLPIVDHSQERERTLKRFKMAKGR